MDYYICFNEQQAEAIEQAKRDLLSETKNPNRTHFRAAEILTTLLTELGLKDVAQLYDHTWSMDAIMSRIRDRVHREDHLVKVAITTDGCLEYTCLHPGCGNEKLLRIKDMTDTVWDEQLSEFRKAHPFEDEDLWKDEYEE